MRTLIGALPQTPEFFLAWHFPAPTAYLKILGVLPADTVVAVIVALLFLGGCTPAEPPSVSQCAFSLFAGFIYIVSRAAANLIKTPFNAECMIEQDSPFSKYHRVLSLLKRWILSTLQGSIENKHMHDYLNEFLFRFIRRSSNAHGMLFWRLIQLAVACKPTTWEKIIPYHI